MAQIVPEIFKCILPQYLPRILTQIMIRVMEHIVDRILRGIFSRILTGILAPIRTHILVRIMARILARVSIPVLALVIALAPAAAQPHQARQSLPSVSLYVTLSCGIIAPMPNLGGVIVILSGRRPLCSCGSTAKRRLSLPDGNGMVCSIVSRSAADNPARTDIRLTPAKITPLDSGERRIHARSWH